MFRIFKDRIEAGKHLGKALEKFRLHPNCVIFGLPRGGIVLANEISNFLHLPLDMFVPRKIGCPFAPEVAVGAVTEDGSVMLDEEMMHSYRLSYRDVEDIIKKETEESYRRQKVYRRGKPLLDLHQKTVIIVDDGIATGNTMRAAISSAKKRGSEMIIVAVPVAPVEAIVKIEKEVDEIYVLETPDPFVSIGNFYQEFEQVDDERVIDLMKKSHRGG